MVAGAAHLPPLLWPPVCPNASRLSLHASLPVCCCRYGNFMQKGIELAKEAVEADTKQQWQQVRGRRVHVPPALQQHCC